MSQIFRTLAAALIAAAAGVALAQSTTGNTGAVPNNTRNLPGNADTGKTATPTGTDSSSRAGTTQGSIASSDRKFIETAAKHGIAEVELGKLAQRNASSSQVKEFGARMERDHGKANEELGRIASAKGLQLPSSMDRKHLDKMEKLQKLSGDAFDKAYMAEMLADHKKDVAEFRRQSKSAKDADVKAFAAKTLPTLEEHLKVAQQTDRTVRTASK
jgi:putative membrane protein